MSLDRPVSGHSERSDGLHDAVASLRRPGGCSGLHGTGGRDRVGGIRLAGLAPGTPVGLVDLEDSQPVGAQVLEQSSAVGAGSFHPDGDHVPVTTQPGQELLEARRCRRKGRVAEQTTKAIERCDGVRVGVGVHAAGDVRDLAYEVVGFLPW